MKKKIHLPWIAIASLLLCLVCFAPFINYLVALSDPAGKNWRLEYLQDEAVDAYLHSSGTAIALVFSGVALLFFLGFGLDLLFRKKASHIALVEASTIAVLAYEITRAIYCIKLGSVNIIVAIFYIVAMLGTLGTIYFYFKKALDGDNLWPYWACFIVSAAFFFFGGATKDSYSILNAYSHFNANNGVGDFEYWVGYGASRLMFLLLCLGCLVNAHFDFVPTNSSELTKEKTEEKQ